MEDNKNLKLYEGVEEVKDHRGDNMIRIVRSGRITYKSTEGYKNKNDMWAAAVNDAIELLQFRAHKLSPQHISRLATIVISHDATNIKPNDESAHN